MFKCLDNPGNRPFPDSIDARCALLFSPSFHFLHPFFTRLINKTIRYRARYRRGNATFFFFSFFLFFFFFFLLFKSHAISKIDRCEIISICFVYYYHHVLYYFWIFKFCSNPISLYESFKKKKEKERKKIHLYLDKRTTRLDASPRIESDNSPLNREVSHPWL